MRAWRFPFKLLKVRRPPLLSLLRLKPAKLLWPVSRSPMSSSGFWASDMTADGWPPKDMSVTPILGLTGSKWRLLSVRVSIYAPWRTSPLYVPRTSSPTSCLLLKMKRLPPEDFGGHLQHLL